MAYIGAEPLPGQNREVDDISSGFNGSTTAFTLQVSSVNVSPESANNILISLGGVIQNPGTDYTIAASTLTFTTAPASGLDFFGLILGAGINTATVADGVITSSKLASDLSQEIPTQLLDFLLLIRLQQKLVVVSVCVLHRMGKLE